VSGPSRAISALRSLLRAGLALSGRWQIVPPAGGGSQIDPKPTFAFDF